MKDFYNILGVNRSANNQQIKDAYRNLAKKYHPDTNKDPSAEDTFKRINEAYETLKDSTKRQEYDTVNTSQFGSPHSFRSTQQSTGKPDDWNNTFSEIFKEFTSTRPGSPSFGQGFTRVYPKNLDIQIDYTITLEEAFFGVSKNINITFPGGENKTIDIDIPAGVDVHTRIKLKGKGPNLNRNAPAGDIYLIIQIQPHNIFQKAGADLFVEKEISSIDAVLGCTTILTTINGNKISVKIPEGSQANSKIRVKNYGMPILNSSMRGDLYIILHLVTPTKLTLEQKNLLKKFQISYKNT